MPEGFPSVGKSTLLTQLTGTSSEAAAYVSPFLAVPSAPVPWKMAVHYCVQAVSASCALPHAQILCCIAIGGDSENSGNIYLSSWFLLMCIYVDVYTSFLLEPVMPREGHCLSWVVCDIAVVLNCRTQIVVACFWHSI